MPGFPVGGHIYDLPTATDLPPLPPRLPVSKSLIFTESYIQSAPPLSGSPTQPLLETTFVQQDEHLDTEAAHAHGQALKLICQPAQVLATVKWMT